MPIAPSTHYAYKRRPPSARAVSDERRVPIAKAVHEDSFGVYGARKLGHALKRKGERIGRDQVARLIRVAGVRGVTRRKRVRPSPPLIEIHSPDPLQREWFRDTPDLVWVAEFTHVLTREGWMYVSFLHGMGPHQRRAVLSRANPGLTSNTVSPKSQSTTGRYTSGEHAVWGRIQVPYKAWPRTVSIP